MQNSATQLPTETQGHSRSSEGTMIGASRHREGEGGEGTHAVHQATTLHIKKPIKQALLSGSHSLSSEGTMMGLSSVPKRGSYALQPV
jgi:hypothetical protein